MIEQIEYELLYSEPFCEADYEAVKVLLWQLSGKPSSLTREQYHLVLGNGEVIVARHPSGVIVGMASIIKVEKLSRTAYYVEDVVVDSAFRGQGIGEALMQKLLWLAEQTGVAKLDLHTSRPNAARLYRKLDFTPRQSQMFERKF